MFSRFYHILFQPEVFHGSALTRPRAALAFLLLFPILVLGAVVFFLTSGTWQSIMFYTEMALLLVFFTLAWLIPAQEMSRLTKYLFSKEDVWTLKEPEDAPAQPAAATPVQTAAPVEATPVQAPAPTTSPASSGPAQPPSP